jgi:hypothetical protein
LPWLALLFVPVLVALPALYPWVDPAEHARWSGEVARPGFKNLWLQPGFFIARSVVYLAVWVVLGWLTTRPVYTRSQRFSAAALLVYAVTGTLAAIDWVMSLMPLWYSTAFGLLVLVGQGLAGLCAAIVLAAARGPRLVFRDLGNLVLVYVLTRAYLAFTQYLVIWAGNLPHEIAWYVPRVQTGWSAVAVALIAGHFFVPLLVLLSRDAKEAPRVLRGLAWSLLALHLVDVCWLVFPSVAA